MTSQVQWLRMAKILVGDTNTNNATDVSEMHCQFHVERGDTQTPNSAHLKIYNLSSSTAKKIQALEEFGRLVIYVGYQNSIGLIFDGTVKQVVKGRDNATDTYVEVLAATLDQAYNFAVVSASLKAGSSISDHIDQAVKAMEPYGATLGYLPPLPEGVLPRGKVIFGMAREVLRCAARTAGTTYNMQDGEVQFIQQDSFIPGPVTVLNSNTGMIGLPEQTIDGIKIRCLMNPNLKIGSAVQINNSSIQGFKANLNIKDPYYSADTYKAFVPSKDTDGMYRVLVVSHSGDTRGQDWYSDLICVGISQGVPQPLINQGYLGDRNPTPVKPYG